MVEIFLRTLPFFAIIGLGYGAGRSQFFSPEATAYLTKFVFFFPLSAMLFRFSANLSLGEVFDGQLVLGYLWGTAVVYGLATLVAFLRRLDVPTAAVEAQCAVIANSGFLGLPMFIVLFGEAAIGPIMLTLAVDLLVFSSLIVILITGSRDGQMSWRILRTIGIGLIRNPMIVSIAAGFAWSASGFPIPTPRERLSSDPRWRRNARRSLCDRCIFVGKVRRARRGCGLAQFLQACPASACGCYWGVGALSHRSCFGLYRCGHGGLTSGG